MFTNKKSEYTAQQEFLMNSEGLTYVTGNPTLQASQFSVGDVIPSGTALSKNEDTGYFEVVSESGEDESTALKIPCLTRYDVKILDGYDEFFVPCITTGNPIEEMCSNVTDAFKEQSRFTWY